MPQYDVGVIGTSAPESPGMGPNHARAYREVDGCDLVACADIVPENAEWFADEFDIGNVYTDYREMLADLDLDVVSVCTPIHTHADIVVDLIRNTGVRAIHCEKPMANTWGDSRLMAQEADRHGVQLTFNHQLRFCEPVRRTSELLAAGEIGELERVEMSRGDLYEAGIHQVDLCSHFAGDVPADWVMGQVDYREKLVRNGTHVEDQTVALWEYGNGVSGFAATGPGADAVGVTNRLIGSEGEIEVDQGTAPRIRRADSTSMETLDCEYDWTRTFRRSIEHVVEAIDGDYAPISSARNALTATELVFGVWESSRRRGRVDLPLTAEDNALVSMVESGDLTPSEPENPDDPA